MILQIRFVWISDRMTSAGSMTDCPFANGCGHSMTLPHDSGSRKKNCSANSLKKSQNTPATGVTENLNNGPLPAQKRCQSQGRVRYPWKISSRKSRDSGDTYTGLRVPPALHLSKVRMASANYAGAVSIRYRPPQFDRFCVLHLAAADRQRIHRQ